MGRWRNVHRGVHIIVSVAQLERKRSKAAMGDTWKRMYGGGKR